MTKPEISCMRRVAACLLNVPILTCVTPGAFAQELVLAGITAPWRYTTNNLTGVSWTTPGYDDSNWSGPGNALLYIESASLPAPKNTPLPQKSGGGPFNTYYFRTVLHVTNLVQITALQFSCLIDDGVVFYLNGAQIQRIRMPAGNVTYATQASSTVGDATTFDVFTLGGDALTNLVEGDNVLSAEVHQATSGSSDIVFGSAVSAFYGEPPVILSRGPYLQLSTPTSIVVRWRTVFPTSSRVMYGTDLNALILTNLDSGPATEHEMRLRNLLADTKYYYAVGSAVTNAAGADTNHFFLTHPWPGAPKPIRIWVIGDAGTADASQEAVRDAFYAYNGTNTVHAWLQLGDNAYDNGTDAEYQKAVFDVYAAMLRNSVTWSTLGNHETYAGAPYPYFDIFTLPTAGEAGGVPSGTEYYYSFDLGMVHFICLDSMDTDHSTNGAMAIWLRSDLEMNTNRWTVAFWHHPPFSKGSHDSDPGGSGYDSQMGEMRQSFLPILEGGGVDLVLSGHSHSYERSLMINGHYGISSTFNGTMVVQPGSGRETNGVGAYLKPDGLGESPIGNRGTIYAVAGSSGKISGGTLNHPAMYTSQNALGSMVLDFRSNRLDAVFLRATGIASDWFTIIKEGTHPPIMTNVISLSDGQFQFTVLCRAYRTNVVEAADSLQSPVMWMPVATNTPAIPMFDFLDSDATTNMFRSYRVRKL